MEIPSGKGFFVETVEQVSGGNLSSFISTCKSMNLTWLAVRIMVGITPANIRGAGVLSKDYAASLKAKCDEGQISLYGYLDFNPEFKLDQQATKVMARISALGLAGLIVHPMVPSKKLGDFFMVLDHPRVSLGLMSDLMASEYRSPNIVASSVDYYMPYKVWGKGGSPAAWTEMAADYRKYSQNPVIPIAPAYAVNGWSPKASELTAFVQKASGSGEDITGAGFFKWDDKQKTGVDNNLDLRRAIMNACWRGESEPDADSTGSAPVSTGTVIPTQTVTPAPTVVNPTPVVAQPAATAAPVFTSPQATSLDLSFTQERWEAVYKDYLSRNGKM